MYWLYVVAAEGGATVRLTVSEADAEGLCALAGSLFELFFAALSTIGLLGCCVPLACCGCLLYCAAHERVRRRRQAERQSAAVAYNQQSFIDGGYLEPCHVTRSCYVSLDDGSGGDDQDGDAAKPIVVRAVAVQDAHAQLSGVPIDCSAGE